MRCTKSSVSGLDNTTIMNVSKRIKLDPPPQHDPNLDDDLEQEHCTICLQPFIDRTIVPVCAHEFCFDCILLWSGAYLTIRTG